MSNVEYTQNSNFNKGAVNILVFNDDLVEPNNLKKILFDYPNYNKVNFVSNPVELISEFLCGDYQVLIIDIKFPYVDGYAVQREIRELSKKHNKNIIIYAYCDLSGFDRIILKNKVDADNLQAMITEDIQKI